MSREGVPANKFFHVRLHECLRLFNLAAAPVPIGRGRRLQIINVVQVHIIQLPHARFHIARYGDVHDDGRAIAAGFEQMPETASDR